MPSPSLAFVFPGQGSQSLGMLAELAEQYPEVHDTFREASDGADADLWALAQQGPEDRLNQTEFTQPALLAAGIAVWRQKNLNYIFEFRPASSTEILTKILPGFFSTVTDIVLNLVALESSDRRLCRRK